MIRKKLGKMILKSELVSPDHKQEALSTATMRDDLSQQYGVPSIDLSTFQIDPELRDLVPANVAHQFCILPIRRFRSRFFLAMADPSDIRIIDEMKFRTGLNVAPLVAIESEIKSAIQMCYPAFFKNLEENMKESPGQNSPVAWSPFQPYHAEHSGNGQISDHYESHQPEPIFELQEFIRQALPKLPDGEEGLTGHDLLEEKAPIVNIVNRLLRGAEEIGASDVHVEPTELFVRVRFRLDGALRTVTHLPKNVRQAVIARIKIMADLDIAERRLPQDGRMKLQLDSAHTMDVRVSVLPCLHGEKVVLRLLDRSKLNLDLHALGLESLDLQRILSALENPFGMMMVTGPTGSGKTTTLYSALQYLNTPFVNIVTIEDPVEYHLNGINQMQIKEEIGLTFAAGLRSFLRQDPDIIMIGEIRDRETANIAVQAALTGHRVFSTLHTNDAPRAITRLLDMGIEPYLLSSSLILIIAQRLVRKICEFCKEPDTNAHGQIVSLGYDDCEFPGMVPMNGRGCPRCHQTGFRGRTALFEILPLSEPFHEKILARSPAHELTATAVRAGMTTLRQSGLAKIHQGVTSIAEVASATTCDPSFS